MKKTKKLLSCLLALSLTLTMTVGNVTSYADDTGAAPAAETAFDEPETEETPDGDTDEENEQNEETPEDTADSDASSDTDPDSGDDDYITLAGKRYPIGGYMKPVLEEVSDEEAQRIIESEAEAADEDDVFEDSSDLALINTYSYSSSYLYNNGLKTAAEKAYYNSMDELCRSVLTSKEDYTETISYDNDDGTTTVYPLIGKVSYEGLTIDRAYQLYQLFILFNPQYYFLRLHCGWNDSQQLFFIEFIDAQFRSQDNKYESYSYQNYADRKTSEEALNALTEAWMPEFLAIKSVYERELAISNKIIGYLTYDNWSYNFDDNPTADDNTTFDQSLMSGVMRTATYYGVTNHTTICAGYAQLTAYFLNAAGIESFSVTSDNHQWNIVNLYGNWYELDNTWADEDEAIGATGDNVGIDERWRNKKHSTLVSQDKNTPNSHAYEWLWSSFKPPATKYDVVQIPTPITINASNFPDTEFRNYITQNIDNGDGELSIDEIINTKKIYCSNLGIEDLKGIEKFTCLEELECDKNLLEKLDLNACKSLKSLDCSYNRIKTLNINQCTALTFLNCGNNKLTTLSVSAFPELEKLWCNENEIKTLTFGQNKALTQLICYINQIGTLSLTNLTALTYLDCGTNSISTLTLTTNTALTELYCAENKLTKLDTSKCTALTMLHCYGNSIATLTIGTNSVLTELCCNDNKLTSLDVSNYTTLKKLCCGRNQLTSLDVSKLTALTDLTCENNKLAFVDLSKNTQISIFDADCNKYKIGSVRDSYALSNIPGFDPEKASEWSGAKYNSTTQSIYDLEGLEVSYTYNCGQDYSETFTFITAEVTKITVVAPRIQPKFYAGYDLALPDYQLKISYDDNTSDTIDLYADLVTGYDKNKTGAQTLTVSYGGKETTLRITVLEDKVNKIEPGTGANAPKTEYRYLEDLDLTTGTIIVTYDSGKTAELSLNADGVTVTGYNKEKVGKQKLTVKYAGKTATFDVELTLKPEDCPVNVGDKGYLSLADAIKENSTGEVTFIIRKSYTEKSAVTFPKTITTATLKTNDGVTLTMSTPTFNANCGYFKLNCTIAPADTRAKTLTFKAADNTKVIALGLNTDLPLTLNGAKASFEFHSDVDVISAAAKCIITPVNVINVDNGKLTADTFSGALTVRNASTVTLNKPDSGLSIVLYQYEKTVGSNTSVLLPKLTVGAIENTADIMITVKDKDGVNADIAGQTILTLAKQDNIAGIEELIKFANKDGANDLSAVQYKKDVRAEWLQALTFNDGDHSIKFSSFEKAFEKIDEDAKAADKANPKQDYKSYTITMNTDMKPDKFTLPGKAAGLTIDGNENTLSLTGVTSLTPKYEFRLKDVDIIARDRQGKAAALAINNSAAKMYIHSVDFDGKSLTVSSTKEMTTINDVTVPDKVPLIIKGGSNNVLTISCSVVNQLSGFDVVNLYNDMTIEKTLTTNTLDLRDTGNLILGSDPSAARFTPAAVTVKKMLKGDGGQIKLTEGFKPITVSAASSGYIKLVSDTAINESVQILNAGKCDLSVFDVKGIKGGSTGYALTRTQSKVYCKPVNFSISEKKFVTFADAVASIETVNNANATYAIYLLNDHFNDGALKFPKAGTYQKLSIHVGNNTFSFTGNVTLTGETEIIGDAEGFFGAINKSTVANAKYTITPASGKMFRAGNVALGMVSSLGALSSDITLDNVSFDPGQPVQIKAAKLSIKDIFGIIESITAASIYADGDQSINLLEKKQSKVTEGFAAGSGNITILVVDKYGGAVTSFAKNYVLFTKFGSSMTGLTLSASNVDYELNCDPAGKVTIAAKKS